MIHQVLMNLGDFSFRLKPNTPKSIRDAIFEWDLFAVTPQRLGQPDPVRADVLASACYSGRIEESNDERTEFRGESSLVYIGDGDSPMRGGFGVAILPPLSFTGFIGAVFANPARVGGLALGTSYSTPATSIAGDSFSNTEAPRQALNRMCRIVNTEIRCNANLTVDYGAPGSLWKSGTAMDVLLSKDAHGNELDGIKGLHVTKWKVNFSRSEMVSKINVNYSGGATVVSGGGAAGTYASDGVTAWDPQKYMSVTTSSNTDASNAGVNYLVANAFERYLISCSVDTPNIYRYLTKGQPGDYVHMHDMDSGLFYHLTNRMLYGGQQISPVSTHRIIETTAPIIEGMGVYAIGLWYNGVTGHSTRNLVTDLTDFIEWETGDTELVLSTTNPLTLRDAINGTGRNG